MKLIVNDNLVDMVDISHVSSSGGEVEVFRYNDLAIKLFKDVAFKKRKHLKEDEIDFLSNIKTKRILLPTGKVIKMEPSIEDFSYYDIIDLSKDDIHKYLNLIGTLLASDSELVGYTEKFIDGNKNIFDIKVDTLLNELEIIFDDVKILNDNLVVLSDLHRKNAIYNGSLYLIDPGNYMISDVSKIIPFVVNELSSLQKQILIECWNTDAINFFIEEYLFKNYFDLLRFLRKIKVERKIEYYQDVLSIVFDREETLSDNIKTLSKKI